MEIVGLEPRPRISEPGRRLHCVPYKMTKAQIVSTIGLHGSVFLIAHGCSSLSRKLCTAIALCLCRKTLVLAAPIPRSEPIPSAKALPDLSLAPSVTARFREFAANRQFHGRSYLFPLLELLFNVSKSYLRARRAWCLLSWRRRCIRAVLLLPILLCRHERWFRGASPYIRRRRRYLRRPSAPFGALTLRGKIEQIAPLDRSSHPPSRQPTPKPRARLFAASSPIPGTFFRSRGWWTHMARYQRRPTGPPHYGTRAAGARTGHALMQQLEGDGLWRSNDAWE